MLAENLFKAIEEFCKIRDFKKKESLYRAIQSGLLTAYKRTYSKSEFLKTDNVDVILDPDKRIFQIIERKTVVVKAKDRILQISLSDAQKIKPDAQLGDVISMEIAPENFDRIAADVVKQIVIQKIHDAELDDFYDEYKAKEFEMVFGEISKVTAQKIYVNLGKVEGIIPEDERIMNEYYRVGNKVHCLIYNVQKLSREIIVKLSRTHPVLLKKLMELEIPELKQGLIEIKHVVREPGYRAKVAVTTKEEKIDPVGTCIGAKGSRINSVGHHLNNEKIDVIRWSEVPVEYIANSLSPAKVLARDVSLDIENRTAKIYVDHSCFSLAIGKEGLNVKLAARLTGYKLDVSSKDTEPPSEQDV